jgi:hypothetical protein
MAVGRAISLFLIDGAPDGRVACELFNWTGKGFRIPRRLLKESTNRPELWKAGVYFLFGRGDGGGDVDRAYVGEAEEVIRRLAQHQDKDFWTDALVFVSKDDNLNKAHVKFLEYAIHEKASQVGRYHILNCNIPNRPAISEVEQAVMTEFFENLQVLVGALGYKVFEPLISIANSDAVEYVIASSRGANARALFTNDGMVVLRDSAAAATEVPSIPDSIRRRRDSLVSEGTLIERGDSLIFVQDTLFSSPSTAAAVVLGRSANGWIEWKDQSGCTLHINEAGVPARESSVLSEENNLVSEPLSIKGT